MTNTNEFYDMHREEDPFVAQEEQPDFTQLTVKDITPSKSNVAMLADHIREQVSEGRVDPIEAAVRLNAMKQVCEEALALIRPEVIAHIDAGNVAKHGCKIEKAEVGTKYDFSNTPTWKSYKATEDEAADERKKLEARLKTIPAGKEMVDTETGEVFFGPAKSSTTSFKITLAK